MTSCLGCGRDGLAPVLSLGQQPLANSLPMADAPETVERRYPLELAFCENCSLPQITISVPPEELFEEYAYFSSYADTVTDNARDLVRRIVRDRALGADDLAMEIASNDGYLLQFYVEAGVPVLGIDPARNVVPAAQKRGVETLCAFFGADVGKDLRAQGKRASVLHANNVLAHVPDVNGVVEGIAAVLADDGVAIIETPYVREMVDRLEFDTIYHEHLFYYSLSALDVLLRRHGLSIVDVEEIPIHGGTLRVTAALAGSTPPRPAVEELLARERAAGVDRLAYFAGFASRVRGLCADLRTLLVDLKASGATIGAYGAAAKGAVLLNAVGVGPETIDFVSDRNPYKQGRLMPGVGIPIVDAEALADRRPDYVLLLAWNFAEEVMAQQAAYRAGGGKFIIPVPEPKVV